ncbi:MAG: cation:proton antiporter [Candidatus Aenigmatarchaeota archaeon]|nr:MAG: cation:proton antiporter [Candidatus Aenigmarchaeota archaeon]
MNLLVSLGFCIVIALTFVALFRRFRLSSIAGMMVGGIIAGLPVFRQAFIEPNEYVVLNLGYAGLLGLMFIAGMEVSWSVLSKEKKDAAVIGILASVTPFLLGFTAFLLLGFPLSVSLFVGIAMSITAEATKAKVLVEMKKVKTKIGSLLLGVGIIDDLIGLSLFIAIGYLFSANIAVTEAVILSAALWSFFLGVLVHKEIGRYEKMVPELEKILLYILSPFDLVSKGLYFSTQSLILEPVLLLIVISLAVVGKMLGTWLTKPFTKLRANQLYLIGWGMNSRGAVELVLVFIAFNIGLIPVNVYSSLIVMAVVTTLAFPLFFTRAVRRNPRIMN